MKKRWIILLICVAVAVLATAIWLVIYFAEPRSSVFHNQHSTDDYMVAEVPHADPLIAGRWHNVNNPQWHKVYYDDFDEDEQLFWGKEWDEADSVQEDDLRFHGNGWFRWEKKGKYLYEYATMDICDVPIPHIYKIRWTTTDSLVYFEKDHKTNIFRFAREE